MVWTNSKSVGNSTLMSMVSTEKGLLLQEKDGAAPPELPSLVALPVMHLSEVLAVRSRLPLKEFWRVNPLKSKSSYEPKDPVDLPPQLKPPLWYGEHWLSQFSGVLKVLAPPQLYVAAACCATRAVATKTVLRAFFMVAILNERLCYKIDGSTWRVEIIGDERMSAARGKRTICLKNERLA